MRGHFWKIKEKYRDKNIESNQSNIGHYKCHLYDLKVICLNIKIKRVYV